MFTTFKCTIQSKHSLFSQCFVTPILLGFQNSSSPQIEILIYWARTHHSSLLFQSLVSHVLSVYESAYPKIFSHLSGIILFVLLYEIIFFSHIWNYSESAGLDGLPGKRQALLCKTSQVSHPLRTQSKPAFMERVNMQGTHEGFWRVARLWDLISHQSVSSSLAKARLCCLNSRVRKKHHFPFLWLHSAILLSLISSVKWG